jgi:glycosyltransferase involved in cell wall biosynthesis
MVSFTNVTHASGVEGKMITAVKKIIVVAPVYNEEANIGEFVRRLALVREPASVVGLLIVDDGSSDQSVTRIEELAGSTDFPIRLVRLSRNFGHQNAVLAGIERACIWAAEERVEWIGLTDADLQDRPEHFANLAQEADGCDVVYAVRKKRRDGTYFLQDTLPRSSLFHSRRRRHILSYAAPGGCYDREEQR